MKSDTKINPLLITAIVAVVIGGASFFGGMKYQQSQLSAGARQFAGGATGQNMMARGQGAARTGANRPINGTILSSDAKSVTVKLADGSSKIVLFSTTTTINKADSATVADLKTGTTVAVFGQTNADGSVSAQSIQLNPVARPGMMGGQASPSALPAGQ